MVKLIQGYHGYERFHGGGYGNFAAYDSNGRLCGFGGIELAKGYDPGENADNYGAFGVYPDPDSGDALTAALNDFDNLVNTYKAQLEAINSSLLAAAQAKGDSTSMSAWTSWHNEAVSWETYAGTVSTQLQQLAASGCLTPDGWAAAQRLDASGVLQAEFPDATGGVTPASLLINDFISQGVAVANDAKLSMTVINYDDSLAAAISAFSAKLPADAMAALNAILNTLGAVAEDLTWSAGKVVLIACACVAAGLWMLTRVGGASVDYGPVKVHGYGGYNKRRGKRRKGRR